MQLLFRSSASFEGDMALLGPSERSSVTEKINTLCPSLVCDREAFCRLLTSPSAPKLADGCCPSLSTLPVGCGHDLIFTFDEDPIFDQLIVTLVRLVPTEESAAAFREALHALYRHQLSEEHLHTPG